MRLITSPSAEETVRDKINRDALADGSFSKHGKLNSFSSSLPPYVKVENEEILKRNTEWNRQKTELLKFQDTPSPMANLKASTGGGQRAISSFDGTMQQNYRTSQNDSANKMQDGSLIEEEMTFEELSSKLGGLHTNVMTGGEGGTERRTFHVMVGNQGVPFSDLSSSVHISVRNPISSNHDQSKNQSLDFNNLPALMQTTDKSYDEYGDNDDADEYRDYFRPRFDFDLRQFNHYSVNKMTGENYTTGGQRGSFMDHGPGDKTTEKQA